MALRARLLWPVALAFGAVTCRQIAGIDDREAEPDASVAADAANPLAALSCGALPGFEQADTPDCRACLAGGCCGEVAGCRADAECSAAVACIAGCAKSGDADCSEQCEAEHAAAQPLLADVLACRVRACADACGDAARCGRPPGPASACDTCLDEACCKLETAAYGSALARQHRACTRACPKADVDCWNDCNVSFPGGQSYLGSLDACGHGACASECALGAQAKCGLPSIPLSACDQCGVKACCAQNLACAQDPACAALLGCLSACGNSSGCSDLCFGKSSVHARALFFSWNNCHATACTADCGVDPAQACGVWVDSPTCLDCANTKCCELGKKAATNAQAMEYSMCRDNCLGAKCESDCAQAFPTGKKLLDELESCYLAQCVSECFPSKLDAGSD